MEVAMVLPFCALNFVQGNYHIEIHPYYKCWLEKRYILWYYHVYKIWRCYYY